MGAAWRMIGVVVVFALALGGIVVERVQLLDNGREAVLAVEPVDPSDFFRGDYVTLNYVGLSEIVLPPGSQLAQLKSGDPIYVALNVAPDGHATVQSVHTTLDRARAASSAVIRGEVNWTYTTTVSDTEPAHTALRVKYGIESYFVPQGEGRALETARNAGRLEMLVAVGQSGEAAIKGMILDGKRAYIEGLF